MNTKTTTKKIYEFTTEEVKFIDRIVKAKVGKYTLLEVLSTEWHICFEYYVHMFSALNKIFSERKLKQYEDYNEIRWLLNLLGDFYNSDCSPEDKAMAKAICDELERE